MIKVTLHGLRLWIDRELLEQEGNAALAPEEHVDENGELTFPAALVGESYAHAYAHEDGGVIKRYGRVIGRIAELQEGWGNPATIGEEKNVR